MIRKLILVMLALLGSSFGQYISVTTSPSGCVTDASGAALASGKLIVNATDASGNPIPFRVSTGTAAATISTVSRVITAGSLATTLQLGNPALSAPVNILYRMAIFDSATGKTTIYNSVPLVANDTGNFNLCKYDPSLGNSLGPLAPGAFGNVLLTPAGDQTITLHSLFINTASSLGYSDAAMSRSGAATLVFGNGTPGNNSATIIAGGDAARIYGSGVKIGAGSVLQWATAGGSSGLTPDVGLSRGGANILNCGNGTLSDASCTFQASIVGATTFNAASLFNAQATGVATSGTNFGSASMFFNISSWSGSAPQTDTWSIKASPTVSGTNPNTALVFNTPNRSASHLLALTTLFPATNVLNQNSAIVQLNGNYWNGTISATDTWTLAPSLGSGTNPTSTLVLSHVGSPGVATVAVPALTISSETISSSGAEMYFGSSLLNGNANIHAQTGIFSFVQDAASNPTLELSPGEVRLANNTLIHWSTTTSAGGTTDVGLERCGAGIVCVDDGFFGDSAGSLSLTSVTASGFIKTSSNKFQVNATSGIVQTVGGVTTAGTIGVPPIVTAGIVAGSSTGISNTSIFTPATASGAYRVAITGYATTLGTAGSFSFNLAYQTGAGSVNCNFGGLTLPAAANTPLSNAACIVHASNAQAFILSASPSGVTGSPIFSVDYTVEKLQ